MKMQFSDVDGGKAFNWGETSAEYAQYRDIYPASFYERAFLKEGLCVTGQTCLDLGTGTGVLPRAMYPYGANWCGADVTAEQIAFAKQLAAKGNMQIDFRVAPAEHTGFKDNSFDVITACQCFGYFDREKALAEIHRLLKPNGRFLILYMAWLPLESEIAAASENLVKAFNPDWSGCGYCRRSAEIPEWVSDSPFVPVRCTAYTEEIPFTRESWDGRMYACRGIGAAALSAEEKAEFRKQHMELLKNFPNTFTIPHQISILDLQKK